MATSQRSDVLHHLRRATLLRDGGGMTDGQLLERFLSRREESAFEALVQRHGPMVWGVCRRTLRNYHDAEDAFQATFLVLARKATSITQRESIGSWLYGTAYRAALEVLAVRRRSRERQVCTMPEPEAVVEGDVWHDARALFDQELTRLPEKYREAVVLCDLEGKTRKEAARQLSIAEGTLSGRVTTARRLLARRLTRHGFTLSAGALAATLSQNAAAATAPPLLLVNATVKAATVVAGRQAALAGVISAKVAALTEGVMKTMFLSKLKVFAILFLTISLGIGGMVIAAQRALAALPKTALPRTQTADAPKRDAGPRQDKPGKGRLLFYRAGHLTLISPDGKNEKRVSKDRDKFFSSHSSLSPDGKHVAYLVQVEGAGIEGVGPRRKVYVRGLEEPEPGTDLNVEAQQVTWSPDGNQLIAVEPISATDPKEIKIINWLVDVKKKEKTALKLPDNHAVRDWSRDGKHFLTIAYEAQKTKRTWRLYLMNRDGTESQALTDGSQPVRGGRLSPDGHKVLCEAPDPERKGKERGANLGLFVLDIQKRKFLRVEQQPLNGEFMGYCWSPDGKRIAYAWRQVHEKGGSMQETESNLVVADADGKNAVTIATEKGDNTGLITIAGVDWR